MQERERLLEQVKEDNAEISIMERQIAETNDKVITENHWENIWFKHYKPGLRVPNELGYLKHNLLS